jgi:hypothetical protein
VVAEWVNHIGGAGWVLELLESEADVTRTSDGMVVTSARRSILDAAEKAADPERIQLAVTQAIERGLATDEEMRRAATTRSLRVAKLVLGALGKAVA